MITKKEVGQSIKYGYFDSKNREFVITCPDTPAPWINYLGQTQYCALLSNTAGGYSFYMDPRSKRVLRYRFNNLPVDRPGRYIYIRDMADGDYFSASWQPVMKDLSKYEYSCRHGLGYSVISSEYKGVQAETTYFVPVDDPVEAWVCRIKNTSKSDKKLSVFSYAEFCLWDSVSDILDLQYMLNIARCECVDGVIKHFTGNVPHGSGRGDIVYFATNEEVSGFDCDREHFIGLYRDESNPFVVEHGSSMNSTASGNNPIGSHHIEINLKAGEEKTIIFALGVGDDSQESLELVKSFTDKSKIDAELERLKEDWDGYLQHFQSELPDKAMQDIVNVWNQYQCKTTLNWSRYASFYDTGSSRGMGYRDTNQDALGAVHAAPEVICQTIVDLASNQFADGSAYHRYFPLTKEGKDTGYSDDQLWLIFSASAYLKETGDFDFLNEEIKYADEGCATLYEHLYKAIEYTFNNVGPHGLPLIGFADWNDCLNMEGANGDAETVWLAQVLVYCACEMVRIAELLKMDKDVEFFEHVCDEMSSRINDAAWDGQWYLRAFDDDSQPVGTSSSQEGKIFLLPQAWGVISKVADNKGRSLVCMDNVRKNLLTDLGIMLMYPGYTKYNPKLGAIATFPPGLKENGGIFSHTNPWAVIAETILGRGDVAYDYYKRTSPSDDVSLMIKRKTEPYVYAQYFASNENINFGAGKNSWLTGAASWNFVAASQYILGIRPDYNGLIIDPCIPSQWKGFKVKRMFRGRVYEIEVVNPDNISTGVKTILLNDDEINGNVIDIALSEAGSVNKVKVILG